MFDLIQRHVVGECRNYLHVVAYRPSVSANMRERTAVAVWTRVTVRPSAVAA